MSNSNKSLKTITREKIADMLREKLGLSHALCEEITQTVFQEIVNLAKSEKKITLKNFGRFYINHKEPRPGLNLQTKDTLLIPPRDVLRFTPAGLFKDQINGDGK